MSFLATQVKSHALQITAGQGPEECRIAVRLLCTALLKEFAGAQVIDVHDNYASALITGPDGLAELAGTIGWVCHSPNVKKGTYIRASYLS